MIWLGLEWDEEKKKKKETRRYCCADEGTPQEGIDGGMNGSQVHTTPL